MLHTRLTGLCQNMSEHGHVAAKFEEYQLGPVPEGGYLDWAEWVQACLLPQFVKLTTATAAVPVLEVASAGETGNKRGRTEPTTTLAAAGGTEEELAAALL